MQRQFLQRPRKQASTGMPGSCLSDTILSDVDRMPVRIRPIEEWPTWVFPLIAVVLLRFEPQASTSANVGSPVEVGPGSCLGHTTVSSVPDHL